MQILIRKEWLAISLKKYYKINLKVLLTFTIQDIYSNPKHTVSQKVTYELYVLVCQTMPDKFYKESWVQKWKLYYRS